MGCTCSTVDGVIPIHTDQIVRGEVIQPQFSAI